MSLTIDRFVSHRFRGFADQENSLEGLRAALNFGVKLLEFDIRVAACGMPMIYHDEYAYDGARKKRLLCDIKASDYENVGGDFDTFPSFEALLKTIIGSGNKDAHFLIDIKDAGFETEITALVRLYRLHKRVTYVSWLPDVLYACHALEPDAPLCLSYWCKNPNAKIRANHKIFTAKNGQVPRSGKTYTHGQRSGWFVDGAVKGDMLDMLKRTSGTVCVPVDMVSKDLVDAYHAQGVAVSVFSYVHLDNAKNHADNLGIDTFFVDHRRIFDALV